jgi:hypothetical protein
MGGAVYQASKAQPYLKQGINAVDVAGIARGVLRAICR